MIRALYNKTLSWAAHAHAKLILSIVALTESIIFPIPPDVLLIPMVIANKQYAWFYATLTTIMNMIGAVIGYFIGLFLYDTIGQSIINLYGYEAFFAQFQSLYQKWGIIILLTAALTPIPFKVFTVGSGFVGLPFGLFVLISTIGRAIRFYAVAGLLYLFGEPIQTFIEKHLTWLFILFIIALAGGFIILKYL